MAANAKTAALCNAAVSLSEKAGVAGLFRQTRFPCAWGAAGETCRETLLRKASEPAAHVAGFGWQLEGFGPPSLPKFFSTAAAYTPPLRMA